MNRYSAVLIASFLTCVSNSTSCFAYINGVGRQEWNRMTAEERRAYERGGMRAVAKLREENSVQAAARRAVEQQEAELYGALTKLAAGTETPADQELVNHWRNGRKPSSYANPPTSAVTTLPPESIPALVEALQNPDERVRHRAAFQLRFAGKAGKQALPSLLKTLGDSDSDVRYVAAGTLGTLGADSQEVVRALVRVLGDAKPQVRRSAAEALGNLLP